MRVGSLFLPFLMVFHFLVSSPSNITTPEMQIIPETVPVVTSLNAYQESSLCTGNVVEVKEGYSTNPALSKSLMYYCEAVSAGEKHLCFIEVYSGSVLIRTFVGCPFQNGVNYTDTQKAIMDSELVNLPYVNGKTAVRIL